MSALHSRIHSLALLRAVFALWLVTAFVGIQIASGTHPHDDDGGHCCPICHVGHIPVLAAKSSAQVIRQDVVVTRIFAQVPRSKHVHRATLQVSRAPPVSPIVAA